MGDLIWADITMFAWERSKVLGCSFLQESILPIPIIVSQNLSCFFILWDVVILYYLRERCFDLCLLHIVFQQGIRVFFPVTHNSVAISFTFHQSLEIDLLFGHVDHGL